MPWMFWYGMPQTFEGKIINYFLFGEVSILGTLFYAKFRNFDIDS